MSGEYSKHQYVATKLKLYILLSLIPHLGPLLDLTIIYYVMTNFESTT